MGRKRTLASPYWVVDIFTVAFMSGQVRETVVLPALAPTQTHSCVGEQLSA